MSLSLFLKWQDFKRRFSFLFFFLFKGRTQLSSSQYQFFLQIKWHQKQTSSFCWFSQSTPSSMAIALTTTRLFHHRRPPLTVRLWCWTWLTVFRLCKPEARSQSQKDLAVPDLRQCWRLTLSVCVRLLRAVLLLVSLWMSLKPKLSLLFAKSLRLQPRTVLVSLIWRTYMSCYLLDFEHFFMYYCIYSKLNINFGSNLFFLQCLFLLLVPPLLVVV